jgi:uroporphyrin-III C-methyltransferase / precorrin-2 dehydrogenase / sirohydrochlorin ferrochelatase
MPAPLWLLMTNILFQHTLLYPQICGSFYNHDAIAIYMDQLPLFVNLRGRNVVLVGNGDAADAKRRLILCAGGVCVTDCPRLICKCARIAFIALESEDEAEAQAARLRGKGMLVNVVDRPEQCDFTTPAIIDRDPVLIAVGTGGASAGMAKALRGRIEAMLPQSLGTLAQAVYAARGAIRTRWPSAPSRRRAIDAAFQIGGALDPLREAAPDAVSRWIDTTAQDNFDNRIVEITLFSNDPEDLTLRTARLLGEADTVFYDNHIAHGIINRARADAARYAGPPPSKLPDGLSLYLRHSAS